MRITFSRMVDRRAVDTLVERDDGVVFLMRGAGGGAELPHDLVHAVVEAELGIRDGIWGGVADGVVWGSMRHVSGRRPPHAGERSERLKRDRAAAIGHAEAVADLASRLAQGRPVLGAGPASDVPPPELAAAVAALQDAGRRWAALAPGETWTVEWGREPRRPASPQRRRPGSPQGVLAHRRR